MYSTKLASSNAVCHESCRLWLGSAQQFGWTRTFKLTELQDAANQGQICIISAQRKDLNRSGHICAVVPETPSHKAQRSGATVVSPLQSQAGVNNFAYGGNVWWTAEKFRKYGFWMHA
ncbi:hypothetical protein ACQ4M4_27815 [Leptolyngbya sp. AN02str]